MGNVTANEYGKTVISEEVIAVLAGAAASECYGLAGMASRRLSDGLVELLGRDNMHRGIIVHVDGDRVTIEVNVIVAYGTKISEVARNIIEKVRYSVEKDTGIVVDKVNVNVQGVKVVD